MLRLQVVEGVLVIVLEVVPMGQMEDLVMEDMVVLEVVEIMVQVVDMLEAEEEADITAAEEVHGDMVDVDQALLVLQFSLLPV